MIYYIIIITIILFASSELLKQNSKIKFFCQNISMLILIIFSGFAYEVGTDWVEYKEIFYKQIPLYGTNFSLYRIESLYVGLMMFFKYLCNNYQIFQFIIISIILVSVFRFLKTNTQYPLIGLMLYMRTGYILDTFYALRQGLVMSIFIYILDYIKQKKYYRYYLINFFLIFIHKSAIFLLIAPILNLNIKKRVMLLLVFFSTILAKMTWINYFITNIIVYLPMKYRMSLEPYLETKVELNIFSLSLKLLIILYFIVDKDYFLIKNKNYKIILNGAILNYILGTAFWEIIIIGSRVASYFFIFNCAMMSMFFIRIKKANIYIKICCFILYIFLILYSYKNNFYAESGLLPYKFML